MNFYQFIIRFLLIGLLNVLVPISKANSQILPDGDYFLVAKHSSKALTAFEAAPNSVILGQSDYIDDDSIRQVWTISRTVKSQDGVYNIRSKYFGGYLGTGADNENGDVSVVLNKRPMSGGWRLKKGPVGISIASVQSGMSLNVTGADENDDAQIIVYDDSSEENATWRLFPVNDSYTVASSNDNSTNLNNVEKSYRLVALPAASREKSRMRRMKLMDYHPSGLFVRKGEKVSISVEGLSPSADGLFIMVGPRNSFEESRISNDPQIIAAPEGTSHFLARRSGLLYFAYTDSGFNAISLPPIDVKIIRGGEPIPLFIDGQTSASEWKRQLTDYANTPFVELVTDNAIITATRSTYQKEIKYNPSVLLKMIGNLLSWYDELSGLNGKGPKDSPSLLRLHYQEDAVSSPEALEDIYMYAADYFVGVPSENMGDLINPNKLSHAWSIWHETGHKYQQIDWSWDQVVETTVNIYSLTAQAHLGYRSRLKERDSYTHQSPLDQALRYLNRKSRNFTDSKQMRMAQQDDGELWVRLVMFDHLRQLLGESFYPDLHRYYRKYPLNGNELKDEGIQLQKFVLRSSIVSRTDLSPFFKKWGIEIDQETKNKLSKLSFPKFASYSDVNKNEEFLNFPNE